jgi:ABC-type branched-subunit amino acid transport system substrate-binding protein
VRPAFEEKLMKRMRTAFLAAGLVGLLATAACSSNSSTSSSTGGSANGGSTAGSSGGTIKVLAIGQFQATSFSFPEMADAVNAAVAAANDAGGIKGAKIQVGTCNDQGDPNIAGMCARQAVQDKVAAVIGTISLFGASITPILQAAKIPYIGELPLTPPDYTSPISFPIDGGNPANYGGAGIALVKSGCTKVGILTDASSTAAQGSGQLIQAGVQSAGGTVTKNVGLAESAPDASAAVSTILDSGAKCIGLAETPSQMAKVITAVRQGPAPQTLMSASLATLPPPVVTALKGQADGVLAVQSPYYPGPNTPTFLAQMKKYSPTATIDTSAEGAWSAATVFIDVAKKISGAVTASSVLAQLNATTSLSIETYPATFNFSKPNPVSQYSRLFNTKALVYKVTGNTFTLTNMGTINVQKVLS